VSSGSAFACNRDGKGPRRPRRRGRANRVSPDSRCGPEDKRDADSLPEIAARDRANAGLASERGLPAGSSSSSCSSVLLRAGFCSISSRAFAAVIARCEPFKCRRARFFEAASVNASAGSPRKLQTKTGDATERLRRIGCDRRGFCHPMIHMIQQLIGQTLMVLEERHQGALIHRRKRTCFLRGI
jgi:hypothetical protein